MKIREAELNDVPNLVPLLKPFYESTKQAAFTDFDPEAISDLIGSLIVSDAGEVFLAETDDGRLVGTTGGMIYPLWFSPTHNTGQELFWYVDPDHRKSKAGKQLFEALESWAKAQGAGSFCMIALSHLHEKRVGQMYESKGYTPMERSYIKEL